MIRTSKKIQSFCLWSTVLIVAGSNIVNYFYFYKHLDDRVMQWKLAMIAISICMFLMSVYIWISQHIKKHRIGVLLSGWLSLYLFINFVGVSYGYNLHTKGFMMILFTITFFGGCHIISKIWPK